MWPIVRNSRKRICASVAWCQAINTSEYDAFKERDELFHELFGAFGEGGFVEPPFNCDYGCNTFIGKNFYANMDCIFLDVARITIGDRVFFGPRVGLYTPVSSDRCDGAFLRP